MKLNYVEKFQIEMPFTEKGQFIFRHLERNLHQKREQKNK